MQVPVTFCEGTDCSWSHLLQVPVDWASVPAEAQDRLQLSLFNTWNAALGAGASTSLLHLFGVKEGQCPPGAFR